MSEILQLLNDFQGIIGTILGSVTTLIVTDILKKRGQLKNYLVSYEAKFQTFRDVGCSMGGKRDEDFYGYSIKYIIQIYNQSDTPKIMRDFRLIFYKNAKEQYSLIPDNEEEYKRGLIQANINRLETIIERTMAEGSADYKSAIAAIKEINRLVAPNENSIEVATKDAAFIIKFGSD